MFSFSFRLLQLTFLSTLLGVVFFIAPVMAAEKVTSNLEKAIKSGKKQILFAGKEGDDVTIKKGMTVTGTSPDKAIINGDIKMENGSSLSNVTVSGKNFAITVAKGASVTLSNVTVQGAAGAGIYAPEGGGTITLRNSRIIKNQKGLYILPGKVLNFSGNMINENREEGLDVRAGVTGSLVGNQFVGNREGGAEIIAGGAQLKLTRNTFSGNKASGLAIQSYRGNGKAAGSVVLQENTFANNGEYGLNCLSPSGGGGGPAFYRATVKALDNTFRGNGKGVIARECSVVNRSSVIPEATPTPTEPEVQETPERDEVKLSDEARMHLEETIDLLHDEEHLMELTLTVYEEATPWWERLRKPVIEEEEKEIIIKQIAHINELRDTVKNFPQEFSDEALDSKRQAVVARSLARMEELRQYFERLQAPIFRLR